MNLLGGINSLFINLLVFRLLIVLSYQIIATVAGWHIYELTKDPLSLGLIGLAEVIPYASCALFAGHAVDHYSRRLFGILACLLLWLVSLTLAAVAAKWIGNYSVLWIYAAIAFTGIARAFIGPTYSSLFALILARKHYAKASGIGSSVFQFGLVIGPALGGILVAGTGKAIAYCIAGGLCLAATLALLLLRVKEPPPVQSPPILSSIVQGLRFVFSNQVVYGAQSLDMFAVLFGGAVSMLPAFIHDIYHVGPEGLGILRAAPALGAVLTGLWLTRFPISRHAGSSLLAAVAGFGCCMIAFALTSDFWIAGLCLMLSGICDGISVVMRSTIMQLATPDSLRGRVAAINGIFIGSSNELGAFESGLAAHWMGLVPSVVFGGVMTLVVVAMTAALAPKLRRLDLDQLE